MAILNVEQLQEILVNAFPNADVPRVEEVAGDTVLVCLPTPWVYGVIVLF